VQRKDIMRHKATPSETADQPQAQTPTAQSVKRNTEGNIIAELSLPEIVGFVRNNPPVTFWVSQDGIETPISTGTKTLIGLPWSRRIV
jgi:hypothetical protein